MKEFCESRLKNFAIQDKTENLYKLKKLIKSEILYVLKNYFDVSADTIDVELSVNGDNQYDISVLAKANVIKIVRLFAD